MKKIILFVVLIIISSSTINAQEIQKHRKNSIMLESNVIGMTSISYDRYIRLPENLSLILGAEYAMGTGFGWGTHWVVPEIGILAFGPRHFLESGLEFCIDISPYDEVVEEYGRNHSPGIRIAYKYQTEYGICFRVCSNFYFMMDPIIVPTVGLGIAF